MTTQDSPEAPADTLRRAAREIRRRGPVEFRYPTQAEIRAELAGHDLACWCPLDQACHADVLLELANGGAE